MEINFSHFQDNPMMSLGLDFYDRAAGLAFGIMAGWIVSGTLETMVDRNMIEFDSRVYQVGCLACDSAMRRAFTREEMERSKHDIGLFIRICEDGFNSETPCAHFDQYMTFREGLAKDSEYAKELDHQIQVHARLMEVGQA